MSNYNFKSARRIAALLAATAVVGVFAGPEAVQAQETAPQDFSVQETSSTPVVAEVVNDEGHAAEQAIVSNNDSPAGVEIGVKEWGLGYDSETGQALVNENPRDWSQQNNKAWEYQQDEQGHYQVKVGDQWVSASKEKPEVAPIYESKDPSRITNQLGSNPAQEMNLAWYTRTSEPVEGASVQLSTAKDFSQDADGVTVDIRTYQTYSDYFERTEDGDFIYGYSTDDDWSDLELWSTDQEIEASNATYTSGDSRGVIPIQLIRESIYHADLRGLNPNTTYYYRVGSEGHWSDIGQFTTGTEESAPFQFIHYTDTQNAYWNENVRNEPQYAADTMRQAMKLFPQADFALHTGDFIEVAQVEDEWLDIIQQTQPAFLNLPHAMVSGNHDAYSTYIWNNGQLNAFNNHVNAPDAEGRIYNGSYYSFDYNGTHFVILNTNDASDQFKDGSYEIVSDAQMAWLKEDLQSDAAQQADWVVVSFHKPLFSGSYHSLQDGDVQANRAELIKVFTENGVDVVISGHDHVNSVSKPLHYTDQAPIGNARLAKDSQVSQEEGTTVYTDPSGTVFVTLNTAGTKLYKDIYNQGIDYIAKVRPKVAQAFGAEVENGVIVAGRQEAQDRLDYWNDLFSYQNQPGQSPSFELSHSNSREGSTQNFATYEVTADSFKMSLWEIDGELGSGQRTKPYKVNEFVIRKSENQVQDSLTQLEDKVSQLEHVLSAVLNEQSQQDQELKSLQTELNQLKAEVQSGQVKVQQLESKVQDLAKKLIACSPDRMKDPVKEQLKSVLSNQKQSTRQDKVPSSVKEQANQQVINLKHLGTERPVSQGGSTEKASSAKQAEDSLPQTGMASSLGLAATSIIAGLGLALDRKRKQ